MLNDDGGVGTSSKSVRRSRSRRGFLSESSAGAASGAGRRAGRAFDPPFRAAFAGERFPDVRRLAVTRVRETARFFPGFVFLLAGLALRLAIRRNPFVTLTVSR
jgi:hypothetical protein